MEREGSLDDQAIVALSLVQKQGQVLISAAVHRRSAASLKLLQTTTRSNDDDDALPTKNYFTVQLFDFLDNQQFSGLDAFIQQVGTDGVQYVLCSSEETAAAAATSSSSSGGADQQALSKSLSKKLQAMLENKNVTTLYVKKSPHFIKKTDTLSLLQSVASRTETSKHIFHKIETERLHALPCLECIWHLTRTREQFAGPDGDDLVINLELGSVDAFMRLDSPAADAVNLLPKPDHPSVFGSLYGVLNRCKTKIGSRTLERWLRQPLLDLNEINFRHNIVELFSKCSVQRDRLRDGPFKTIPDLDTIANKSLPEVFTILQDMVKEQSEEGVGEELIASITERFVQPLSGIMGKFANYDKLIEHVLDLSQLPDLKVNSSHDATLQELAEEQDSLEQRVQKIFLDARSSWGSSFDIKLERDSNKGYYFRSTRGDDAGRLQECSKGQVKILSILKNGVHFTLTALERISERYLDIEKEYHSKQEEVVGKVLEVALTYLPLLESVGQLISELDVLSAFAIAAVTSPQGYVRPKMLPLVLRKEGDIAEEQRVISLKDARHPCVELMDNMNFIPNDYDMMNQTTGEVNDQAMFQIITGPNMGGKSTYIRAIGCISVLAQIGSFVPCSSATISVVDCILARVGAGDAVQKGVSTFMAEMLESSVILNTATRNSLIIIDELGRGTSTYDGFGLAWAISDYIIHQLKCFCLFATHFHEVTALAQDYPLLVTNKHVSAVVDNGQNQGQQQQQGQESYSTEGELRMLYRLQDGPCTQSFGIHVAKSADFPLSVIREAQRKADHLERLAHHHTAGSKEEEAVLQEQGREKRRRIEETLDKFHTLQIPMMLQQSTERSAERVKACLKELFPLEALSNVV